MYVSLCGFRQDDGVLEAQTGFRETSGLTFSTKRASCGINLEKRKERMHLMPACVLSDVKTGHPECAANICLFEKF